VTKIDWGKLGVAGVFAGVVWTGLSILLLGIAGRELTTAVFGGAAAPGGRIQVFMFATNIGAAVWATWLYATLRAHYGPGLRTGAVVGVAWWIIVSMQSMKWLAVSPIPATSAIAPGLLTLPAIMIAAIVAGWCYESLRWKR
jgi:hypothetical protein